MEVWEKSSFEVLWGAVFADACPQAPLSVHISCTPTVCTRPWLCTPPGVTFVLQSRSQKPLEQGSHPKQRCPQGTLGDVLEHLWLSRLGVALSVEWEGGMMLLSIAQCPGRPCRERLGPNVCSAKGETLPWTL